MAQLTVSGDLVLGAEQTLVYTKASNENYAKYTIYCKVYPKMLGTQYIAHKQELADVATFSFTPPISYALYNTTGTEVQLAYRVFGYDADGTEHSISADVYTYSIPETVKPDVELTISDPTGYADVFGAYIQKKSKLQIEAATTNAYGSNLQSRYITADGNAYTEASVTTPVIKSTVDFDVAVTVVDRRGRSDSDSVTVPVLAYESPQITKLAVHRCDADGAENDQGEYVKVTFSAKITSLGSQNTAAYAVKYKKPSESAYTTGLSLDVESAGYEVTDHSYIFAADSGSSYQVVLEVTDYFESASRSTPVSTAFTLINWLASGLGMAFGKVAELAEYLEIAFKTMFYKAVTFKDSATFEQSVTFEQVADFNGGLNINGEAIADLLAASSSGAKTAVGTYTGTGENGSTSPNALTFDFTPKFLMVWSTAAYRLVGIKDGNTVVYTSSGVDTNIVAAWEDTGVSWYYSTSRVTTTGAAIQLNTSGTVYSYIAIG